LLLLNIGRFTLTISFHLDIRIE